MKCKVCNRDLKLTFQYNSISEYDCDEFHTNITVVNNYIVAYNISFVKEQVAYYLVGSAVDNTTIASQKILRLPKQKKSKLLFKVPFIYPIIKDNLIDAETLFTKLQKLIAFT